MMEIKINLDDAEIKKAIIQYVENKGIATSDKDIDVQLTAGRKNKGYSAVVSVDQDLPQTTAIECPPAELTVEEETEEDTENSEPEALFG